MTLVLSSWISEYQLCGWFLLDDVYFVSAILDFLLGGSFDIEAHFFWPLGVFWPDRKVIFFFLPIVHELEQTESLFL